MAFQADSNIPLSGVTPKFNNPFDVLARGQQQRMQQAAAQQDAQIREQQLQHGDRVAAAEQTAANEQADYSKIIGNPDLTDEAFLAEVKTKVPGKYDAAKTRIEQHKATAMSLQASQMEIYEKRKQFVGNLMEDVAANGYDPVHAEIALKTMEQYDPEFAPKANEYRQQIIEGGPAALKKMVDSQRPRPTAKEGYTLGPDMIRFDAAGKETARGPVKAPTEPASLDAMLADALKRKDGPAQREILNLMGRKSAETRTPEKAPSEGLVQIAGPDGAAIWVRKSDAEGKPAAQAARGVTGIERQSLAFYNRAAEAAKIVSPLEEKIAGMGLAGQVGLDRLPNWMQTDANQSYRQAQRAFTEARLRKESGAAINDKEYEKDAKTYFAQPGDSKATIAQKQKARDVLLSGMAYSAGKAYDEFYGEPRPGRPDAAQDTKVNAAPAPVATAGTSGTVAMVAPDGRPLQVPAAKVAEMEAHGAKRR